jgi:leader peptidase (prepilin peptidase) / N-methyltransferase
MVLGIWIYDMIQILGSIMIGQLAQGGGDAKLMAMIGAWTSWKIVLLSGAVASTLALLGFVVAAGYSMLRNGGVRAGSSQLIKPLPLGPFIALGATISLFGGDLLVNNYQQLMLSPDRYTLMVPLLLFLLVLLFWTRKLRLRNS